MYVSNNENLSCKKWREKKYPLSQVGNWTPVSRVTGGDTHHYTTEDLGILRWLTQAALAHSSLVEYKTKHFILEIWERECSLHT